MQQCLLIGKLPYCTITCTPSASISLFNEKKEGKKVDEEIPVFYTLAVSKARKKSTIIAETRRSNILRAKCQSGARHSGATKNLFLYQIYVSSSQLSLEEKYGAEGDALGGCVLALKKVNTNGFISPTFCWEEITMFFMQLYLLCSTVCAHYYFFFARKQFYTYVAIGTNALFILFKYYLSNLQSFLIWRYLFEARVIK